MVIREKKYKLPGQETQSYRLLELIAISGDFPSALLDRLSGGISYREAVVYKLKKSGLVRTFYRDRLRTYRLTALAKKLLLAENPERFSFYLTGKVETNQLKSEVVRRIRLCRIAAAYITVLGAGVAVFRDHKPAIFRPNGEISLSKGVRPAFYGSREIKEIGAEAVKIHSSRLVGLLLAVNSIFVAYNSGVIGAKWDYRAEMRVKTMVKRHFCEISSQGYPSWAVCGLLLGDGMEPLYQLLTGVDVGSRRFFLLDGSYEHFYYLPNDRYGERVLQLLCDQERVSELTATLMQGLKAGEPGGLIENDAIDQNGNPVLFGYGCDMPRLIRFVNGLQLQERQGTVICFDFQKEILCRYFGEGIKWQTIEFEKFERRFYP